MDGQNLFLNKSFYTKENSHLHIRSPSNDCGLKKVKETYRIQYYRARNYFKAQADSKKSDFNI